MFKNFKNNLRIILISSSALIIFFGGLAISSCSASLFLNDDAVTAVSSQSTQTADTAGFDTSANLPSIIRILITTALGVLALIMVILIIVSGYQWMTAGGNEETVKSAQARIKNAIIGLVIVLSAYLITYFIFTNLPYTKSVLPQGETSK